MAGGRCIENKESLVPPVRNRRLVENELDAGGHDGQCSVHVGRSGVRALLSSRVLSPESRNAVETILSPPVADDRHELWCEVAPRPNQYAVRHKEYH
jgi:hypothetical protein